MNTNKGKENKARKIKQREEKFIFMALLFRISGFLFVFIRANSWLNLLLFSAPPRLRGKLVFSLSRRRRGRCWYLVAFLLRLQAFSLPLGPLMNLVNVGSAQFRIAMQQQILWKRHLLVSNHG